MNILSTTTSVVTSMRVRFSSFAAQVNLHRLAWAGGACAFGLAALVMAPTSAAALTSPEGYELTPLTRETAQQAIAGKITYKDGTIDTLIFGKLNPDPEADPDGDGLKTNEELFTYQKDGKTYLYYASHPMIEDTDGDGWPDKNDDDPLSWKVSPRDAVMMQKLAYRDDDYVQKVLNDEINFTAKDCYEGNACYKLMHNEWSQYWKFTKSWHHSSGMDAVLIEFSNKRYPFLKDQSTHLLGFRGTEGKGDLVTDAQLGLGIFPRQGHPTVDLADELDKLRPKNTYVAGHSLGGFLAQIFLVRSVGNPYGPKEMNDAHDNLNYWDKEKKENPEIKQIFTFNAPALSKKGASTWLKEYSYMGDTLTNRLNSKHYVTGNDSITRLTGAMEGAIRLEPSQGGHASNSFFEAKYTDVEGYAIGKRRGLNHVGYHNDLTDLCHFVKPTHLLLREEGTNKLLEDRIYACTEANAKTVDIERIIPKTYEVVSKPDALTYGEDNVIVVRPAGHTLTYVFKVGDQVVHEDKIHVAYKSDYTAPSVPQHADENREYLLAPDQQIPKLAPEEIVEDQTFEVALVERDREVVTLVNLIDDQGTTVKTVEYKTKPSETNSFDVQETDLPEGYEFVDADRKVVPGTNREVKVAKKRFTITYAYVDADNKTLKEEHEQVFFNETSTYEPQPPADYAIKSDYVHKPIEHVRADQHVQIPVEPKTAEMHTVTLTFVTNTSTGKKQVAVRTLTVKHNETVPQQEAPAHEKSAEGYSWKIADDAGYKEIITADKTIEIALEEVTPVAPAPAEVYTVLVKYVYDNNVIKTETQQVPKGKSVELHVPTSSKGTYIAQTDGINLTPNKHTTITVPMTFEKKRVQVTRQFVDETGAVIYQDTVEVPVDSVAPILQEVVYRDSVYQVNEDYRAPTIIDTTTIQVPMHRTNQTGAREYVVTLAYYEGDTLIETQENILVEEGQFPPIEMPDVTDGRDGTYALTAVPDPVTQNGEIRLNMVYEPNRYPVHLVYVDKTTGAKLKEEYVEVETGGKPQADYSDLQAYQVDSAFVMPAVTSERTIEIPMVTTKPTDDGEASDPTLQPGSEPAPAPAPDDEGNQPPVPAPVDEENQPPVVQPTPALPQPNVTLAQETSSRAAQVSDAAAPAIQKTHDTGVFVACVGATCGLALIVCALVLRYRAREHS